MGRESLSRRLRETFCAIASGDCVDCPKGKMIFIPKKKNKLMHETMGEIFPHAKFFFNSQNPLIKVSPEIPNCWKNTSQRSEIRFFQSPIEILGFLVYVFSNHRWNESIPQLFTFSLNNLCSLLTLSLAEIEKKWFRVEHGHFLTAEETLVSSRPIRQTNWIEFVTRDL